MPILPESLSGDFRVSAASRTASARNAVTRPIG